MLLALVGAFLASTPMNVARTISLQPDNGFIDLFHQALVTLFYQSLITVAVVPLGMYP